MDLQTIVTAGGNERDESERHYLAFFDGDTLAAELPENPDYSYFASQIFYLIKQGRRKQKVHRLLVDCLQVKDINLPALEVFINLGRGLNRQGITFVLLDAPGHFQAYVSAALPTADWIDSSTHESGWQPATPPQE